MKASSLVPERLKIKYKADKNRNEERKQKQAREKREKEMIDLEQAVIGIALNDKLMQDIQDADYRYEAPDGNRFLGIELSRGTVYGLPAVFAIDKVNSAINVVVKYGTDSLTTLMWRVGNLDESHNYLMPADSHTKIGFREYVYQNAPLLGRITAKRLKRKYR